MPESTQHKLDRVRRPRVQITYDVETLGSIVKTELPFVVGIMADLSGNRFDNATPAKDQPVLKDRKFVEIDRGNFNQIMEKVGPKVTLKQEGFTDELTFKSLEDFEPKNVLDRVDTLRAKFESRTRLSDLLAKLDGNPKLQANLVDAIENLDADDKAKLNTYVQSYLSADSQAGGEVAPDLTKLNDDEKDEVKSYIVRNFPETMMPGLTALAAALTGDDPKKLTTNVIKKYPFKLLTRLPDADKKALITKIVELDPSSPAKTINLTGTLPDLTPYVAALSDENKKKVKEFVVPKLTAAITAPDLTVLDALGPYERDEVKAYAVANLKSAKVTPVGEGGLDKLEDVVAALSADDRQKFMKHVASQYPATVNRGGQS